MELCYDRKTPQNDMKRTPLRSSSHHNCFRVWTWSHGWDTMAEQIPVFTSTPLDSKRNSITELLEWQVSALLERTASMASPSSGYKTSTPVARDCSKRRPNRRLLDKSFSQSKDTLRIVRVERDQAAMVKKFMVSEEKLKGRKITNTRRLRL